jgi:hypothetical protein
MDPNVAYERLQDCFRDAYDITTGRITGEWSLSRL